jgi:hypothetical protein
MKFGTCDETVMRVKPCICTAEPQATSAQHVSAPLLRRNAELTTQLDLAKGFNRQLAVLKTNWEAAESQIATLTVERDELRDGLTAKDEVIENLFAERVWETDDYNRLCKVASEEADRADTAEAKVSELVAALELLVQDVSDYEAWERPCHALDVAREALAKHRGTKEEA